ncbi:hypothetical protein BJ741DRAFT_668681 [Chytriomyces cf. hyalinus JEL632]|nr:hypothetical protein BJ741DRAFT_668681 [Chytriomyces cf. hyalinus JEL632]
MHVNSPAAVASLTSTKYRIYAPPNSWLARVQCKQVLRRRDANRVHTASLEAQSDLATIAIKETPLALQMAPTTNKQTTPSNNNNQEHMHVNSPAAIASTTDKNMVFTHDKNLIGLPLSRAVTASSTASRRSLKSLKSIASRISDWFRRA